MNKALDEVRAEETRRIMRCDGRDPVLKKSRRLLLKRSENLGEEQYFRLRDLLRYNLKTVRAYLLKEAFQQLWEYNSPAWAGKFLDEWCRQTMRSRIDPMKEDCSFPPSAPKAHPQLFPGAETDFQRCGGRPEQQGQSHNEKIRTAFAPTESSNLPSITHLASCLSRNQPTISSEESSFFGLTIANALACVPPLHTAGRYLRRIRRR
jgi:hypothetical protein